MAMPERAVDKHSKLRSAERKVWLAGKVRAVASPPPNALLVESAA
jgi:hypothetical protein